LILLDCCASGTANTGEGNGVSELLSACAYNSTANGVGPYSFTNALVIELKELSKRPSFSVGELYSNIYRRIQNRMPEDGRERHPPPIHLALTQENLFPRSIQLSVCRVPGDLNAKPLNNFLEFNSSLDHNIDRGEAVSSLARAYSHSTSHSGYHMRDSEMSSCDAKVPRLTFAVRLKDTLRASELSEDLFKEWLRTIPAVVEEVKVEAGFDSFSSLLIVSLPIAMSLYIPRDPAIICLGPVTSFNQVSHPTTTGDPKLEMGSPNQSQQCVIDDPLSSIEHSMATKQPKPEIVHAVPTLTPDMSQSVAGNDEAAHMQPETVLNAVVDEVPPQTTSTEPSVIPMISSLALTTDKMTADDQLELARQLKTELSRELELTKIEPKAEEPAPAEDEWSFGISKKDKKKKKDAVEEKRTLEPEPEAAVDDFGWGSFGTSKEDKKKTGKGVVEESENSKEPDPELETPVEDNGWGSFVIKKDKKKKRAVEGPPKAREPTPGSHLKPDNDHFDFGLGTKKDKKVEKKRATRDAPKSKEPIRESDTQRDEGALAEALSGLQIMIRKK
jgi:hypothetical protein